MAVGFGTSEAQAKVEDQPSVQQSEAYRNAMAAGLQGVVFMCDEGKERSLYARNAARSRGEIHTELFPDGMNGFITKYKGDRTKIIDAMKTQFGNKYVRVIIDSQTYPSGFEECLKDAGISYQVVKTRDLMVEARKLGQDPIEFFS